MKTDLQMKRLPYKKNSSCTVTTGLTSDLETVSCSHFSVFLYSCREFGCRVRYWLQGKEECSAYFTSHTVLHLQIYAKSIYNTQTTWLYLAPALFTLNSTNSWTVPAREPNRIGLFLTLLLVSFATTELTQSSVLLTCHMLAAERHIWE